ncbi:MAG TPA: ribosomal protein S18-alanine N-acetyltransferase [Pyrinomonadaceae bacterium]
MSITHTALETAGQTIRITNMTEHDLLEVVEIEEASGLSRWGWSAYYAELQGKNSHLMLVARIDPQVAYSTKLAGYIVARMGADELHINNVAVREEFRRRGIGRRLIDQILAEGKRAGASAAYLELRAGNKAALALYEECGFRVTSRRKQYYSDPIEDALVMITDLRTNA